VMMSITDTGTGIDREAMPHLFEPFFTTKTSRTGLGLSMVYGIVQQSSGHITVDSTAGHGATFRVFFPLETGAVETKPKRAADSRGPADAAETILVVEDFDMVRQMAERTLRARGYTVLSAGTSAEAIKIASSFDAPIHLLVPNVVLTGGVSGPELASCLRASHPTLRALFMSNYDDDALVDGDVLEKGSTVLQKPFTATELLRTVRAVLDKPIALDDRSC
jgi:two-component system, cell cycle sensor histidine kinase and response regulator CckA